MHVEIPNSGQLQLQQLLLLHLTRLTTLAELWQKFLIYWAAGLVCDNCKLPSAAVESSKVGVACQRAAWTALPRLWVKLGEH